MLDENFIKLVRRLVKEGKYVLKIDATKDQLIHNIPNSLIEEAFDKGLIAHGSEIYPSNVEDKGKLKRNYCLYKYGNFIYKRFFLAPFILKKEVIIIHLGHANYGSIEERFFRERIKS